MSFIDFLTPKNTEEVKPGLFIQKRTSRNGKIKYRKITPAAWNGKINWKVFILGDKWVSSLIWFLLIMYLAWSYHHDTSALIGFEKYVLENTTQFCSNQLAHLNEPVKLSVCTNNLCNVSNVIANYKINGN